MVLRLPVGWLRDELEQLRPSSARQLSSRHDRELRRVGSERRFLWCRLVDEGFDVHQVRRTKQLTEVSGEELLEARLRRQPALHRPALENGDQHREHHGQFPVWLGFTPRVATSNRPPSSFTSKHATSAPFGKNPRPSRTSNTHACSGQNR